jgi:hypothetical protein
MLNWKVDGNVHKASTSFGAYYVKPVVRESDGKEFGYLRKSGESIWSSHDSVDEAKQVAEYLGGSFSL